LKTTYTEEAIADILEAITYLNERNPTAAANLDAASRDASNDSPIENLTARSLGRERVRSYAVGPRQQIVRGDRIRR
jgi:plasmid stabilization system protein ParE